MDYEMFLAAARAWNLASSQARELNSRLEALPRGEACPELWSAYCAAVQRRIDAREMAYKAKR